MNNYERFFTGFTVGLATSMMVWLAAQVILDEKSAIIVMFFAVALWTGLMSMER